MLAFCHPYTDTLLTRARASCRNGDPFRGATEAFDVLVDPLESDPLVMQAAVGPETGPGHLRRSEEPANT